MTDDIAERASKIGGYTLRSIGDISRHQRIKDAEDGDLLPRQILSELRDDNAQLMGFLRSAHEVCARHVGPEAAGETEASDSLEENTAPAYSASARENRVGDQRSQGRWSQPGSSPNTLRSLMNRLGIRRAAHGTS